MTPDANANTNAEMLVERLRNVRRELSEKRLFKKVSMQSIQGAWIDEDDSFITIKRSDDIEKDRNSVYGTLVYCNSNLCLGISNLSPQHLSSENNISNILFDLANMPLSMVLDRLKKEGAILE